MAGRLQTIPYFHAVETLDDTSMELERDHYGSKFLEGSNTVLEPDECILLRYHSRDDAKLFIENGRGILVNPVLSAR